MKTLIAVLITGLALFVAGSAFAGDQGQRFSPDAPESIRASAILTGSAVDSTTVTLPANCTAVHFYAEFTIGSLTNTIVTPICQSAPAGTVYSLPADAVTIAASGNTTWRVDAEKFGGRYVGLKAIGTGTTTNSLLALKYRFEYK